MVASKYFLARKAKNISQMDLAKKLGLDRHVLGSIEQGQTIPNDELGQRIASTVERWTEKKLRKRKKTA